MAQSANTAGKKQMPENPLDSKKKAQKVEGADLIKSIVSTETSKGEEKILEAAPEVDLSLVKDLVPHKSVLLLLLKTFFGILVVVSVISFLFFTSQLSNKLDFVSSTFNIPNISKELASSNSEITKLQTSLNLYRYLQIKAYLDEFSFYGDSYMKNYEISHSQTSKNSNVKEAAEVMAYLTDDLRDSFNNLRDIIVKDFAVPLFSKEFGDDASLQKLFENQLKMVLTERAGELADSTDPQAQRDYKNNVYTTSLVGNASLRNLVIQTDFDAFTEGEIYEFIKSMNSIVVNDLSTIQTVKESRIRWSDIINEIYLRTVAVDSYHSENYFDELGGIQYTSYDFDSSGPSISIVGETKRFDTTNFTMIVNLIDELNNSDLFENAEMHSFSKSGSLELGYTASVKLNLGLIW